jgi:hypothetical protein
LETAVSTVERLAGKSAGATVESKVVMMAVCSAGLSVVAWAVYLDSK